MRFYIIYLIMQQDINEQRKLEEPEFKYNLLCVLEEWKSWEY